MLNQEIDKLIMNSDIREIKSRLSSGPTSPSQAVHGASYRTIEDYKRDAQRYQSTPKAAKSFQSQSFD